MEVFTPGAATSEIIDFVQKAIGKRTLNEEDEAFQGGGRSWVKMKEYKFEERTVGNVLEDKAKTIGEKVYLLHGDMKIIIRK